jgi:CRP/FNR family transcriptional regulator, cyclic AMP receptor protein
MALPAKPSALGLRIIKLLEGLPEERLQSLALQCNWRRYEPEQLIFSRDGADRDVHLIVSGRVRITIYSTTGRQVTFNDERAGAAFGEVAAIDDKPRTADAVALESLLIASMPSAVFKQLLRDEPIVLGRILLQLTTLVRRLSDRVIDLSTLGVQNRVHAELLRLAREAGVLANRARIDPAPRHTDIASRVSTYREQVTRELSVLAKSGVLGKDAGALVVEDVDRLERLVKDVH